MKASPTQIGLALRVARFSHQFEKRFWRARPDLRNKRRDETIIDGNPLADVAFINDNFQCLEQSTAILAATSSRLPLWLGRVHFDHPSRSGVEHGIYVSNSGDRPVVRRNTVWGNNASGIQLNADASLGGDGIISNAIIEANTIYDNGSAGGAAINCDGVQDSVIRNNLLYENHSTGIALFMIDGAEGAKRISLSTTSLLSPPTDAGQWRQIG